jgi:hypothetical protein
LNRADQNKTFCLIAPDLQAQNLPILALKEHLHGPAANLAVNGELLLRLGGVHREFEELPTKWTLDFFRFLHLPDNRRAAIVRHSEWPVTQKCQFNGTSRAAIFLG